MNFELFRWVDLSGDSLTQQLKEDQNLSLFTNTADLVKDLTFKLGVEVATAPDGSFPEIVAPFPSNTTEVEATPMECTNKEVYPTTTLTIENETKQHKQKKEIRSELNPIGEHSTSATTRISDIEMNLVRPNSRYKGLTNTIQKPTSVEMETTPENNESSEPKQDIRETQDNAINEIAQNCQIEGESANIVIEFKQF